MFAKETLKWYAAGGFVAGLLDIVYACVFSYFRSNVHPARVLQSVASGVLGKDAYQGGAGAAALGLFLHFVIAFGAAALFFLAAAKFRQLAANPWLYGALFGAGVYAVMNLVIVPLSRFPGKFAYTPLSVSTGLAVHMFLIGVPIALAARRAFLGVKT